MKKLIFSMIVALMATVAARAQQIAVVSDGTTTLYHTLQEAIEGAPTGSVIYLPGGGFPISDDVKIDKKLTIIGIGHYAKSGNVDGVTTISGNLFFTTESDDSAVLGCYISGNINIGDESSPVNSILIKYCNLNSVQILNSLCTGTYVNQNYIRGTSNFGNTEVTICNNVIGKICNVAAGLISYNICCHYCSGAARYSQYYPALENVNNSTIISNIFRGEAVWYSYFHSGESCVLSNNLYLGWSVGEEPVIIDASAEDLFEDINNWTVSPVSNFHFKEAYKEYESQVGIYAGSSFSDKGMAPVPYIIAKRVDEQTDASGMLNVRIRVSASN